MYGYGLTWFYLLIALALFWTVYIWWRIHSTRAESLDVFQIRQEDDAEVARIGAEAFGRAYMRSFGPRPAIFAAAASICALLAMPLVYVVSEAIFNVLWRSAGQIADMEHGLAPWLFFMTLLMIGCWIGILAFFARAYHHNRPGSLDLELKRELETIS